MEDATVCTALWVIWQGSPVFSFLLTNATVQRLARARKSTANTISQVIQGIPKTEVGIGYCPRNPSENDCICSQILKTLEKRMAAAQVSAIPVSSAPSWVTQLV
ncbi:hypothetical protein FKM82_022358 [Ascaphus truei]